MHLCNRRARTNLVCACASTTNPCYCRAATLTRYEIKKVRAGDIGAHACGEQSLECSQDPCNLWGDQDLAECGSDVFRAPAILSLIARAVAAYVTLLMSRCLCH